MWPIAARVAWTVCLSVGCERETHQTYEPIWMPSRMWTLGGKKNHVLPGSPDPPPWNGDKTWACPDMPAVYIVYLISKDSSDAAFGYRYLLHSTTRCKARLGCSPPRLLIIVDSSVNWFACVQRECQINVWGRKVRFHGGAMSVHGVLVLSTEIVAVDLVYYTYDGRARPGWLLKFYDTSVTVAKIICG